MQMQERDGGRVRQLLFRNTRMERTDELLVLQNLTHRDRDLRRRRHAIAHDPPTRPEQVTSLARDVASARVDDGVQAALPISLQQLSQLFRPRG